MSKASSSKQSNRFSFRGLSIQQRLPLLICIVLLFIVVVFSWTSYIGVRQAALQMGKERIRSLSDQLSSMFGQSMQAVVTATRTAAHTEVFRSYLQSGKKEADSTVLEALQKLRPDSSWLSAELFNKDRQRLAMSSLYPGKGSGIEIAPDSLLENLGPDSCRVGKLYAKNDSILFPILAAVTENNMVTGYLVRWRLQKASPRSIAQFSDLLGTNARLYIGNKDETVWTDLEKRVPAPLLEKTEGQNLLEFADTGSGRVLAGLQPVAHTDWVVLIEMSRAKILEASNRFLKWVMMVGAALIAIGIFLAWRISRGITHPLQNLTTASSRIASGDYTAQVDVDRYDEIGKLARAFNAMAVQVKQSQQELEEKMKQYRLLFQHNPMPMWIISTTTLQILDVNEAAIKNYGYSREEFLQLTTLDLRPREDIEKYFAHLSSQENDPEKKPGVWRHKKKDGTIIMVEVITGDIMFRGEKARLKLAYDITEKLKIEEELMNYRIRQQKLMTEVAIQVQERERNEIGKELHDNINQVLASIKMYLKMYSESKDKKEELIQRSSHNVAYAIEEIRRLSKGLVAPFIGERSLQEAILELAEEIKMGTGLEIKLITEPLNSLRLDKNMELMLYRITQEQLNNIRKYARASHAEIILRSDGDHLHLTIADDGVGFDPAEKPRGIGLKNIQSRVSFYSGHMEIHSAPGKGCRLEITIPLTVNA
jgi:PAS domain S-box-containing protein